MNLHRLFFKVARPAPGLYATFLFTVFSFLLCSSEASAQQSWQEVRKQYLILSNDTAKKDSALLYAYKLKEIALKQYGKESNEYYRSLNSIGFCEVQLKRYEDAKSVWIGLYKELQKKQDTTFNHVKGDVAFNLYLRIYTYHFKRADSALFFADAYLKAQANINGKTTRAQINSVTTVALYIEQNFGTRFAVDLYKQSLTIRKELFDAKDYELRKNLFDKVDSLFTADSAHYQYYLGDIANLHCVITETQTKNWNIKQLDSLCLNSLRHFSYESSLLLALESESAVLKDHPLTDSTVAYHMHLLGYLFRYKYKVKSLADFFYDVSTIKNRDHFVTKFTVADKPGDNEIVMQPASQITASTNSSPTLITPVGHLIQVNSVAFSPDRKYLISGSYDHTAKIWEAATTQLVATLGGMTAGVSLAKYSPDGKFIITLSEDNDLKIWSSGGNLLKTFTSDKIGLNCADISKDGSKLLIGCSDGLIRIIDLQTGKELFAMVKNNAPIYSAVYSPDYKYVLTGAGDGTASVWNAATGNLIKTIYKDDKYRVNEANYSPSGKYIAIRCGDYTARVFDVATGIEICMVSHKGFLQRLVFSPDEKKLFAFSNEGTSINGKGTIKIVELQTGRQLKAFKADYDGGATAGCFDIGSNYLVTANGNGLIMKVDTSTGRPFAFFKGHSVPSEEPGFSRDGIHLVVPYDDGHVRVWDVKTARVVLDLPGHRGWVYGGAYNNTGTKILTWSKDSTARVWDASTGKALYVLESKGSVVSAKFSNDDAEIITASNDGIIEIWDAATGKPKYKFDAAQPTKFGPSFSIDPGGTKIITAINIDPGDDNYSHRDSLEKMKIWDMNLGKLLCTLDSKKGISAGYFIDKGKKIFTICTDSVNRIFDSGTGKMLSEQKFGADLWLDSGSNFILVRGRDSLFLYDRDKKKAVFSIPGFDVTHAVFSKDDKTILTSSFDNTVKILDAGTGKILHAFEPTPGYGIFAVFSPDEKMIVGSGGSLKLWSAKNYELGYSSMDIDSTDYYTQISSGYYMCTSNAAKLLHYVTENLDVITFDQLDIKYNRPDKILEGIGCPDTALIHAYHRAYEKRINKLGIDTSAFKSGYSVPKADFINRNQIAHLAEQKKDTLSLHISGSDSTYNLDRFNVWVNKVPVYGTKGISLKNKRNGTLDTTVTITLSLGDNRIETSVTDVNGTESYHIPLYVKYVPDKFVDTMLYFVGIGIDKFADENHNLNYSVKDIQDLAKNFNEKYKGKCKIYTLYNKNVCKDSVIALKQKLLKSGVNDKVIIAYSGHGLLSKDYDYFLSTYNVDFKDPAKDGLPYDALENLLDSIPARKKLMLIDACHSGELDKDEMNRYTQTAADRKKSGVTDVRPRGGDVEVTEKSGMSMASSFELMKQLFVNVGKSTGATIISAAGGTQYALEKNNLHNGVFTYSIREYMQQNEHVNLSALKQYVNKRVTELTAGMQVPTTRNETDVVDWQVW